MPAIVVRAISHLCDLLHVTPLSYGHYELLKFDNLPAKNDLVEDDLHALLKREPSPLGPRILELDPTLKQA